MRPLLVVPGLFSTEIHDDELGYIWGTFRCLYGGPPIGTLQGLRGKPGGIMRVIPLPAGLKYDLLRGLERALVKAGYRPGETLFFHAYDWRQRVVELGAMLAAEVRTLAERCGDPIDILGLSNGGLVIKAAYAADATLPIERVLTSGSPHAGTIETVACMDRGYQFAPLGRTVTPEQFMSCPAAIEAMPPPEVDVFLASDPGYDIYDVETWRRLRLSVFRRNPDDAVWIDLVRKRLADLRESWRVLQGAAAPKRLICICGTGLATQVRIALRHGRVYIPGEGRLGGVPAEAIVDGDGALSVAAASAWPGAQAEVLRIKVTRHRDTVRTPVAFKAILQALG